MTDSVKFIFKTIIKVPCIIAVTYLIFNIFGFTYTCIRVLGIAQVVQQVAVENNYIPSDERSYLESYLTNMDSGTPYIDSLVLTDVDGNAFTRKQYGDTVTVGVKCNYQFIIPLTPKDQLADPNDSFKGVDGTGTSQYADPGVIESRRNTSKFRPKVNIEFNFTVPGLKYYPDLDN